MRGQGWARALTPWQVPHVALQWAGGEVRPARQVKAKRDMMYTCTWRKVGVVLHAALNPMLAVTMAGS